MLALFVLLHGVYVISLLSCQSPIGKNFVSCCQFFSLPAIVPDEYYDLEYKQILVKARDWTRFVKAPTCIYSFIRTYYDS